MDKTDIVPGLYRVHISSAFRHPSELAFERFKEFEKGRGQEVTKDDFFSSTQDLGTELKRLFQYDREHGDPTNRSYFHSPVDFFNAVIQSYLSDNPFQRGFGRGIKGFELGYTALNPSNPYFTIDYIEETFRGGKPILVKKTWEPLDERGRMEKPLLLVTNLDGVHSDETMNLMRIAVNDIRRGQALFYNGREDLLTEKGPGEEIPLTETAGGFYFSKPTPFYKSRVAAKASRVTWASIGFSPLEIFVAMESAGFVFPPMEKS